MNSGSLLERDAASFRDPTGYVFKRNGRIFRAIDSSCAETLQSLFDSGKIDKLIEKGKIVPTSFVDDSSLLAYLSEEHPGYENFLEHEQISPVLYPTEWCVSMLADAGVLTLDLQIRLLKLGYSLKDATAYNVLFTNGRPTFIDLPSIEPPNRLDIWYALGQFGQMFTFPLLLTRHCGWDLRSYFLGELGGRDLVQVSRSLGRMSKWLPRNLLDVTLPSLLHGRFEKGGEAQSQPDKKETKPDAQLANLKRVRNKVRKLAASYRPQSDWSGYASQCNYDAEATQNKKNLVSRHLEESQPKRVLDIGCNTGEFSYLAAEHGAKTIAADADHDAVEVLYRRLRSEPANITPIVLDICNPTPATGYLNQERPSFIDRINVDCVLALAVIHHLRVSGNLSFTAIRDLFARLTERDLIIEFVPTQDSMFKRLTQLRHEDFDDVTIDHFRNVFTETFDIVREECIPGTIRTLMLLRKKEH